jgi:hypothetical protein
MKIDAKTMGVSGGLRFPPREPTKGIKFHYFRCQHFEAVPEGPQMAFATVDGYVAHKAFVHANL